MHAFLKLLALAPLLLLAACTHAPVTAQTATGRAPAAATYRLDYTFTVTDAHGPVRVDHASYVVEDGNDGELRSGENVPLVKSAAGMLPRQDVGLHISARASSAPGGLLLRTRFELSSTGDGDVPSVRKLSTQGASRIALGTSAPIFHLDQGDRHYDLAVLATRL